MGSASGQKKPERNWYKIATFLLSLALGLLSYFSLVYYKRVDAESQRRQSIQNKIAELQQQAADLERIPKIRITIDALENSGLPASAFAPLAEVPAVLTLQHVGGGTARGITVEVGSTARLIRFLPECSVERFTFEIDPDTDVLRVELDQLRRNSVVRGTIMCSRIGKLTKEGRVDVGMIEQEDDTYKPDKYRTLSLATMQTINPTAIKSASEIEYLVEKLRVLLQGEDSSEAHTSSRFPLIKILLILFGVHLLILAVIYTRQAKQSHALGNKILECMRLDLIRPGMTIDEVKQTIGPPQAVETHIDGKSVSSKWKYEPTPHSMPGRDRSWEPDLVVHWTDCRVACVEYWTYGGDLGRMTESCQCPKPQE